MFLMFADEADQEGQRDYLIYAGIFVDAENALAIDQQIKQARTQAGMQAGDSLKFASRTRPENMDREHHTELKNRVLQIAAEHNVKACCYLVPHDIARTQSLETKLRYGSNVLLQKFDEFLTEEGGRPGVVYFDRNNDFDQHTYFVEVFQRGLEFSGRRRPLENLVCLGMTSNGASHLASLCDIVVGSCRYAINEPNNPEAGATLLRLVAKLMWGTLEADGTKRLREKGLCIRPLRVTHSDYEANIQALINRLNGYLAN